MLLWDFTRPDARESVVAWQPVGDRVMGGVSQGALLPAIGHAVFRGTVSSRYGGGFASVRTSFRPTDWSDHDALELVVRGDGHSFSLNLRDDERFDAVLHRVSFAPRRRDWQAMRFPFETFRPTFRGREVDTARLRTDRIVGIGLMISERQIGPFELGVRSISAVRARPIGPTGSRPGT